MMARRRANGLRFLAALGLIAGAASLPGQTGAWVTRGPTGGKVYCIVADPFDSSTLYIGTDVGVYKSEDGGGSWSDSSAGMPSVRVQTIAVDSTTGSLYAGTLTPDGVASVGIFKSTDGAASWTSINAGLTDPITETSPVDIEALAIDPTDHATIIAGSRFSEIFKSSDAGATWQNETVGGVYVSLETSSILFDPSQSSTVYAATTQGLLRSTDGGLSWNGYGDVGNPFFTIVADPTSPTTFYAGNVDGSGILKSTNSGGHWSSANRNLPVNQAPSVPGSPLVFALAIDPAHPSTLYAGTYGNGLFVSTDGAATWEPADTGLRDSFISALALVSGQSASLYAGTLGGGVYGSIDGAATWTPMSSGLNLALVDGLVADPSAAATIYAATFDGVRKSTNGGVSWQTSDTGLPADPVAMLTLVPGATDTLLAGTLGGGLFKSTDGAATWSASTQGLSDSFISAIAVDPSNPSTLYAGTNHPYDGTQSERVFKSSDGGQSWTQTSLDASSFPIDFLAVNPANSKQVIAISQGVEGYFQSLDAGGSWSTVASSTSCGGVNAILFSSSTVYLAGTGGVCRSADGGTTWVASSVANLASVTALLIDPADSSVLYAGATPSVAGGTGGVFRSVDGGQTWEAIGSGLSTSSVTSLAIDSLGTLHAGIYGGSVAEQIVLQDRSPVEPISSSGRTTKQLPSR